MPFLRFLAGPWQYGAGLLATAPALAGYGLKLVPNWLAKERVFEQFLGGRSLENLTKIAQHYALESLPALIRPDALARLRWHQQQQHQVFVVSASLEMYLSAWAEQQGVDCVLGTRLSVEDGMVSGKILGSNCYGAEKVQRLSSVLGDLDQYRIYAYGDSKGDRELLALADFPYYRPFRNNLMKG